MLDNRMKTFIQVAESGSFSKAANKLFLSPVAIKKQIDSLEAEVGTALFVRTNQGVELTVAGQSFFEGARKLSFLSERTLSRARSVSSVQKQTIRVGTSFLRPCKELIDIWVKIGGDNLPFRIEIVSFDDDTASMNEMVSSLGKKLDCFIAPCDSNYWRQNCSILILEMLPFCLAMSKHHPLAAKSMLEWDDLDGETVMLVPGSDSPTVGRIRADIKENHPLVHIVNCPVHFDISVFNKCEQSGYALQTYKVWEDVHPSLTTVPVNWDYKMPYGIIYSNKPSEAVSEFVQIIQKEYVGD